MGTPLTGSTVASTYTSLLKTTDNAALTASLRTISDGNGNDSALQISSAGVASTGTLAVTGAASLSSLSTSGNITVGGNLVVTGTTTLSAGLSVPGTLSCTGNFSVNTNKFTVDATSGNASVLGTLGVTGATSLSSLSTSGAATVGTTLGVTGNFSVNSTQFTVAAATGNTAVAGTLNATGNFEVGAAKFTVAAASGNTVVAGTFDVAGNTAITGDLSVNGNTTIGNASGDSLTVTAGTVAINNLPSKTTPVNADTVIIRDSAASNAVKTATISAVSPVRFVYSEDIVKTSTSGQVTNVVAYIGSAVQVSGSTTAWEYTWTPKVIGNKCIIRVSIPLQPANDSYCYAGIAESPYAAANYIGVGSSYCGNAYQSTVHAQAVFTSSSSSHTFRIFFTSNLGQFVTVAANPATSYFGNNGSSTFQAKVHFELIEFA
jgi:hypothetical protein